MFKHLPVLRRPTPSMAVAITALVVASTGTSYAAVSMSGKDLKRGSVPANRIKSNSLTGKQINEAKLRTVPSATSAQQSQTAVTAQSAVSAQSAVTAQSAQTAGDAASLQGKSAASFMAGATRLATDQTVNIASGSGISLKVFCEPSERAISGGGGWYVPGTDVHTTLEAPITGNTPIVEGGQITGWEVSGRNLAGTDRVLRTYAVCVSKTP